jgi:hypothetical protein
LRYRFGVLLAIALTGILSSGIGRGAAAAANSQRVALLELFTSEGCDSCPPVDHWVSNLPRPELVPQRLVVLAYHVDYWNYLGWTDRFSQRRFTERQQTLVRTNDLRTAYTPQLVLNGRDFRDVANLATQVAQVNAQAPRINLALKVGREKSELRISVLATRPIQSANNSMDLYLALYENNLETRVIAGENRGRLLRHDYVVRRLIGPEPVAPDRTTRWEGRLTLAADWKIANMGLAAFVQSTRSGEVYQAAVQSIP